MQDPAVGNASSIMCRTRLPHPSTLARRIHKQFVPGPHLPFTEACSVVRGDREVLQCPPVIDPPSLGTGFPVGSYLTAGFLLGEAGIPVPVMGVLQP